MALCTEPRPAYIPAPNTAQAVLSYSEFGSVFENVLYFEKDGGWDSASLQDLADTISTAWAANVGANVTADCTLIGVKCTDVSSETGPVAENSTPHTGVSGDGGMPGNVTVAVKFTTALRGRSFRGRMYYVGLTEGNVTGNSLASGFNATLIGNLEGFFGDILAGAAGVHSVASYCNGGSWRATAVVTPVTGYSTDGFVDSQRRRLAGRGQ